MGGGQTDVIAGAQNPIVHRFGNRRCATLGAIPVADLEMGTSRHRWECNSMMW